MFKTLLKKQLLEINSYLFQNRKTGKLRSKKGVVLCIALYVALFLYLGVSCFFSIGNVLGKPLIESGFAWLYFAIVGLLSIAVGIFGSVFNTYASLYRAKDNDLLLSLPIPPAKILSVRIVAVFSSALLYESIIYIPALIARFIYAPVTFLGVIFSVLLWVVLGALITFFTLILGFVVAAVSARLKNKTFVTVFLFLVFFALYYFVILKASDYITHIVAASEEIGKAFRSWVYPLYAFGIAAEGNALAFIGFTLSTFALTGLAIFVMAKTFIGITTSAKSGNKVKYKQKSVKEKTAFRALLSRETKRLFGNAMVFLNCSSSTIMAVLMGVVLLINKSVLTDAFAMFGDATDLIKDVLILIAVAAVMMFSLLNNISGPSVSLEAKTLDIIRSLPVKTSDILLAKQVLHVIMTIIPAVFIAVSFVVVLESSALLSALIIINAVIFTLFGSAYSLMLGLKFPNLKWTNEIIAVKQGMGNMLAILGGMGIAILTGGALYGLRQIMSSEICLIVIGAIFTAITVTLNVWINKKGTEAFENL